MLRKLQPNKLEQQSDWIRISKRTLDQDMLHLLKGYKGKKGLLSV